MIRFFMYALMIIFLGGCLEQLDSEASDSGDSGDTGAYGQDARTRIEVGWRPVVRP
jgi:hypothetical protein